MARKACMVFKPFVPGTRRRWVARRNGIRYEVTREIFGGEWTTRATINGQTRQVAGSGKPTKAAAIKVACEHAAFHKRYFKR